MEKTSKSPPLFKDNSLNRFSKNDARINLDSEAPLVYIRYRDHFLSTVTKSSNNSNLTESECVGWLTKETTDLVHVVYDRCSLTLDKNQRIHHSGRGLAIFKEDILEIRRIEF